MARNCYVHAVRHYMLKKKNDHVIQTEEAPREDRSRPQPMEGLIKVEVDGPEKIVQIGVALP